jgi:dTDP-4-dehydrorhamnose reductase
LVTLDRFLVTGGNGMVGRAIPFGMKPSRAELDVTNPAAVKNYLDRFNPTGIVCLSSVNIRKCEEDPLEAYRVNVFAARTLAQEAAKRKIPIVLVSAGAIFQGPRDKDFDEQAEPFPANIYGQTKYLAEILISSITPEHLILRTGWLFGGSGPHHLNFIDKAIGLAKKGEAITATNDQTGSPTLLKDFIVTLMNLIKIEERGIYHIVNEGRATALDVAKQVISLTKSSSVIEKSTVTQLSTTGPKRSPSEALTSTRLHLRSWKEALRDYVTHGLAS